MERIRIIGCYGVLERLASSVRAPLFEDIVVTAAHVSNSSYA